MKYYTNIVPTYAYSKLLEKGMPVNLANYAEVFDWLMTKDVCIYIFPDKGGINEDDIWRYSCEGKQNFVSTKAKKWIECADDAIYYTIEHLL